MARRNRFEKAAEELLNETMPMDVLPFSNGEFLPPEPTQREKTIMAMQDEMAEKMRRKFGMSRRQFVRTGAAFAVGLWALNKVDDNRWGYYALAAEGAPDVSDDPLWKACDLNYPGAQLSNPPGEFVFDVQSHHIDSDADGGAKWRAMQPVHMAFICGFFGATNHANANDLRANDPSRLGGNSNVDLCQNTGRWQYLKDLFLDSSTTMTVLSPIPSAPDEQQPLPFAEADETAVMIENLTGTMRCVTHGYVMPNRGSVRARNNEAVIFVPNPTGGPNYVDSCSGSSANTPGGSRPYWLPGATNVCQSTPSTTTVTGYPFLKDELDWMEERAIKYRKHLRGWKVYTPYGDVPFTSGMAHDDDAGMAMNDQIRKLHDKYGITKCLASHKGVALPTFDARRQATDDVPGAAKAYPDIAFIIYHSAGGFKSNIPYYPTDVGQDDSTIDGTDMNYGTVGLLYNLKKASWAPEDFPLAGMAHSNNPNVFIDSGSVWPSGASNQSLWLGMMIKHLGPLRIGWGTDCLWSGSPQRLIVQVRALQMTDEAKGLFNLPYGLDGDRYDPRVPAIGPDTAQYYTSSYASQLQANLNDPSWDLNARPWLKHHKEAIQNWPTDGVPHPERSIRNGYLGRNHAVVYEVDPDATFAAMSCDDVQKMRDSYYTSTVLGQAAPARSNTIYGPRTRSETIAMLNQDWKKGWRL